MIGRFELGVALLSEYDDDGFLGVQCDAFGGVQSGMPPFELHHAFGFSARPRDPDSDGTGCSLLHAREGDQAFAWLANDPRTQPLLPELKKGGSMQYAATGAFDMFDGEDGTKTLYVPVEFDSGGTPTKAHAITVGLDGNGDTYVGIVHADGMAITFLDDTVVIKNAAGDAYIELNSDGVIINGNLKINGAVDLGDLTLSAPLAKAAELATWAALVNGALNSLGVPVAPLSPTVATALTKGT